MYTINEIANNVMKNTIVLVTCLDLLSGLTTVKNRTAVSLIAMLTNST